MSLQVKVGLKKRPVRLHILGNRSSWSVPFSDQQASSLLLVEIPCWHRVSAQERGSAWVTKLPDEPLGALWRKIEPFSARQGLIRCVPKSLFFPPYFSSMAVLNFSTFSSLRSRAASLPVLSSRNTVCLQSSLALGRFVMSGSSND